MSDDDEDATNFFGTALPQLADDVIPTKKPITVADQIAVDENGRRRFHGAFTGGFSAGYWNTVGSKEGWQPQKFKSSRHEKAQLRTQNPNDFMDEEDTGEFGINPQRIQTTTDFSSAPSSGVNMKQKQGHQSGSVLDGNPVVNLFLNPPRDRTCVSLLKRMGWRGEKSSGALKKKNAAQDSDPSVKVYNCSMGPIEFERPKHDEENSSDSCSSVTSIRFDLDDFEILTHMPKVNRFGLGYVGLMSDRDKGSSVGMHVNLFAPFEVADRKTNKKLSITGQAFGVGAFEDDDDDIYALEDMTTYNFETTKKQEAIMPPPKKGYQNTIEGFQPADQRSNPKPKFEISLPVGYRPRNWLERKSRFGPVVNEQVLEMQVSAHLSGTRRHMMTPDERGAVLNVETKTKRVNPFGAPRKDNPVLQKLRDNTKTKTTPSKTVEDRLKQLSEQFDNRFISEKPANPETTNDGIQKPVDKNESRFVSSENASTSSSPPTPTPQSIPKPEIVVVMKRETTAWFPCMLLCQKMNIADPTKCKDDSRKSGPFSLLAHVNPFAGTKQRDKEFEKPIQCEDEVVPNAYVPKQTKEPAVVPKPFHSLGTRVESSSKESNETKSFQEENSQTFIKHSVTIKPVPVVPKTELELSIHKREKSHPSEKKDIYKAIFESSDEESEDEEAINTPNSNPAPYVPPRLAEDVNILRNTSPPRGIFAGLSNRHRNSPPEPTPNAIERIECDSQNGLYGPSLPVQLASRPLIAASASTPPLFVMALKRRHISTSSESSQSDEWIAKDDKDDGSHQRSKAKKGKHAKHKKSKSSKSSKKKSKKNKKSHR